MPNCVVSLHENMWWKTELGMEHNFDILFVLCMDKNVPWRHVEKVYIIPESELYGEVRINIYNDFSNVRSRFKWIEKFGVNKKEFDDVYHTMKLENCKVLRKKK